MFLVAENIGSLMNAHVVFMQSDTCVYAHTSACGAICVCASLYAGKSTALWKILLNFCMFT